MKYYTTELTAINPHTGELVKWSGPYIPAISWTHAEEFCQKNGFGYLTVTGELVSVVGTIVNDLGFIVPNFKDRKDYDKINDN